MATERASGIKVTLALLAIAGALSSCAPRAALIVEPSSPALRGELGKLAAEYSAKNGIRIALSDAPVPKRGRAAVVVGWAFPSDYAGQEVLPIPAALLAKAGFGTALAFERWGREGEGWRELPLLWDAWGIAAIPGTRGALPDARASAPGARSAATASQAGQAARVAGSRGPASAVFSWEDGEAAVKEGRRILAPGGESGVRQSLFWFMGGPSLDQGTVVGMMLGDGLSSPSGRERFRALASVARDPLFLAGAERMRSGDIENMANASRIERLIGNCQWLRRVQSSVPRSFSSFAYPLAKGYALPASILAGRVVGSGAAADKARSFLAWLASPPVQKELSEATGYMAANFSAPNLDPNALAARVAASEAQAAVLIVPDPARGSRAEAWDGLLGRVLSRPAEWERTLAEGMGSR